jgi:DNA-binding CsgD family transcriptional regulator
MVVVPFYADVSLLRTALDSLLAQTDADWVGVVIDDSPLEAGLAIEVAQLVAEGFSSKEVASRLDLSVRTVEKHRANIMDKIGVREVASLVRWCVQTGLVKL